jgi:hypothetical protein
LSLRRGPRKLRPRNDAEARAWLKQFASNLRDVQVKPDEIPLNSDLATWFADAVDAFTLEKQTKRKRRAWSMDGALGLERPPGRQRGTHSGGLPTAIHAHYLRAWGYSWIETADFLQMDVRSLQRICKANADGIIEHLVEECGDLFVPLGYDVKDRKLIVNEGEATTVRMIFERFAEMGSVTKLILALKAEGITGKRGKPIDKYDLFRLLNDRIYVGETAHKGMAYPYPGEHEAIIDRALWDRVHVRVDRDGR